LSGPISPEFNSLTKHRLIRREAGKCGYYHGVESRVAKQTRKRGKDIRRELIQVHMKESRKGRGCMGACP
jgi:hypothetical protein